jgi:hypothetical protein
MSRTPCIGCLQALPAGQCGTSLVRIAVDKADINNVTFALFFIAYAQYFLVL